jgi:DNA polymerase (family 10)
LLAAIRGDASGEALSSRAARFVATRNLASETDLEPVVQMPPPDLDADVLKLLRQIHEAGAWVLLESTLADLPADLRWLLETEAITLEQLAAAHQSLGITSAADITAALQEETLRDVAGIDGATEAAIVAALPHLRTAIPRIPLGRATSIAEPLLARLRSVPGVAWAEAAGSLRRGHELVGDVELVASAVEPGSGIAAIVDALQNPHVLHRSARRLYCLVDRIQVGVRFPEPDRAGAVLVFLTGSATHCAALRTRAAEHGWRLASNALYAPDGREQATPDEASVYEALSLPFIPPEIREGGDEIAAAAAGALPLLVSKRDIRGDLHMHTTWSDGRDSIEAMVMECRSLGYEYMAITDHSPHSAAVRNLTADAVKRQADEIAALRDRHRDIVILHGCEADILVDGSLDFPERVLERFDIVLASLHERAGHGPDQLLERYRTAMRHPLVTMITHPTNRVVPNRSGYELDYDRLFEIAVETDTVVEIDGSPAHLDLDGPLARRAIAAGATVAINSDCHRSEMLNRQMQLGLVMARRGWVEARHVLNTRSIADVRALIARKRAGR